MATHKSAEKRHRQSLKRRSRNRHAKGEIKDAIKAVRSAIAKKVPAAELETLFRTAQGTLKHNASKGHVAKTSASRKVSRLAKAMHAASASA